MYFGHERGVTHALASVRGSRPVAGCARRSAGASPLLDFLLALEVQAQRRADHVRQASERHLGGITRGKQVCKRERLVLVTMRHDCIVFSHGHRAQSAGWAVGGRPRRD